MQSSRPPDVLAARLRLLASPLAYAAAAGVVLIAALVVAAASQFTLWQQSAARMERLRVAERGVLDYALSLQAAESALRGYLLTGHADNLNAYNVALERADDARQRAQAPLAGDPEGLALLADAGRAGDATTAEWRRMIVSRDAQGGAVREGSPIEARIGYVNAALDPLRQRVAAMIDAAAVHAARLRMALIATAVALVVAIAATVAAHAILALRERRSRLELESLYEREAQHDRRTRLPNRRFFTEWVGYAVAGSRRDGDGLGLLMIGIDSGDVKLRGDAIGPEIAHRLRALKRESDFLGVIEENVFGLAALHIKEARHVAGLAQRVLRALSEPPLPGAKLARIAPCVGVALFPDDADDLPGLVAAADSALSAARHAGGHRVMFHGATEPGVPAPPLTR